MNLRLSADNTSLKQKMIDHLKFELAGLLDPHEENTNNFDMEAAIYWLASDYHSGQDSELYSILSTSKFNPSPLHNSIKDEGETAEMMYNELVKHFSKEIGHEVQ